MERTSSKTSNPPLGIMASEPVALITMITTFFSAVFAAIVLAVPTIDPQWEKVLLGVIVSAWPIITTFWARGKVVSPSSAQEIANVAARTKDSSSIDPMQPDTWRVPADTHIATRDATGTRAGRGGA